MENYRSTTYKASDEGGEGGGSRSTNPFVGFREKIGRTFGTAETGTKRGSNKNNHELTLEDAEAALFSAIETRTESNSAKNPRDRFAGSKALAGNDPHKILSGLNGGSNLLTSNRKDSWAKFLDEPPSRATTAEMPLSLEEGPASFGGRSGIHPEKEPLLASPVTSLQKSGSSLARKLASKKPLRRGDCASMLSFLNPVESITFLLRGLFRSTMPIAVVCFAVAWILFHYCNNPSWGALNMPDVSLSWWFNFIGRQLLLLELSRLCQFILIDCIIHSTRLGKKLGALVRLVLVESRGYPFVLSSWGLWDLILLQGNGKFQMNWLYFTGIGLYSSENPGNYIFDSDWYLGVLHCMVAIGCATTIKRVWLKTAFGRRNVATYKSELEGLLNEIILLSEIAELAMEADRESSIEESTGKDDTVKRPTLSKIRWKSLRFDDKTKQMDDGTLKSEIDVEEATDEESDDGEDVDELSGLHSLPRRSRQLKRHVSVIKNQLDRWEEPIDKSNETGTISLDDILKFAQAVEYMNQDFPFSENFGKVGNRDELIMASESIYSRLVAHFPGSKHLAFSVLEALAIHDDGSEDHEKKALLRYLFRADVRGDLTMIAFVQPCDWVYRRLRYFRASVGNAIVIDKQAEIIINAAFRTILFLFVLSMLKFNPWAIVVSMSTLLVTASFAVGPSCAKAIEGILLIIGRRPYDIGDRIVIAGNPGDENKGVATSWFVEDISLFSTTLRFAMTGEVATIGNGTISQARITNLNRSRVSHIVLDIVYHISLHDNDNLQVYTHKLQHYIDSNPNVYDGINCFQCEGIDTNLDTVTYKLSVRCRVSWQNSKRVFVHRGNLHRQCIAIARGMKVEYDTPAGKNVMYFGGSLLDGSGVHGSSVHTYGRDLVEAKNLTRAIVTTSSGHTKPSLASGT